MLKLSTDPSQMGHAAVFRQYLDDPANIFFFLKSQCIFFNFFELTTFFLFHKKKLIFTIKLKYDSAQNWFASFLPSKHLILVKIMKIFSSMKCLCNFRTSKKKNAVTPHDTQNFHTHSKVVVCFSPNLACEIVFPVKIRCSKCFFHFCYL